jgi:hypothetical protein
MSLHGSYIWQKFVTCWCLPLRENGTFLHVLSFSHRLSAKVTRVGVINQRFSVITALIKRSGLSVRQQNERQISDTCRGYSIRLAFCTVFDQWRIHQTHQTWESELMQVWNFTAWSFEPVTLHMLNCVQKLFKFLCRNSNLQKTKFWVHSLWLR